MTKFEQVGVNIQNQAFTKDYAVKAFKRSCDICCLRGLHLKCDHCAIEIAHKMTIAALEEQK